MCAQDLLKRQGTYFEKHNPIGPAVRDRLVSGTAELGTARQQNVVSKDGKFSPVHLVLHAKLTADSETDVFTASPLDIPKHLGYAVIRRMRAELLQGS
mmetsp:Transcript_10237/g.30835  ORF Transcript_10237/g.30835 Transcript_10237/m.30835 type:complete len:98 (-) Transcript_10237:1424-1717(-)